MQTIQNQHLTITASEQGGELQHITRNEDGLEYLWHGDPTYWGKRSPVLFPIVGSLNEETYFLGGKSFTLPRHGLARNSTFQCVLSSSDQLVYELRSGQSSKEVYPYDFRLKIGYKLVANTLTVTYSVENLSSEKECFFSVGGHPAFNCPVSKAGKRSDYSLVFDRPQTLETQLLNAVGLRSGERTPVLKNEAVLKITDDLFDHDALIFDQLTSKSVTLQKGDQKILTVNFQNFSYLGIWSASREAPFVCIEPWLGITDHVRHNQQFTEKEGIIRLEKSQSFSASFEIVIH